MVTINKLTSLKKVTFAWVNSADQMSDTATKPLPRPAFERQRGHNMGIVKAKFKVHTEIFRENEKTNNK